MGQVINRIRVRALRASIRRGDGMSEPGLLVKGAIVAAHSAAARSPSTAPAHCSFIKNLVSSLAFSAPAAELPWPDAQAWAQAFASMSIDAHKAAQRAVGRSEPASLTPEDRAELDLHLVDALAAVTSKAASRWMWEGADLARERVLRSTVLVLTVYDLGLRAVGAEGVSVPSVEQLLREAR